MTLTCLNSPDLVAGLAADRFDVVLAEEPAGRTRGECLLTDRLVWVGVKGGDAHRKRPLPISICSDTCAFRPTLFDAMQRSGLEWRSVTEAGATYAISATVLSRRWLRTQSASTTRAAFGRGVKEPRLAVTAVVSTGRPAARQASRPPLSTAGGLPR